MCFQTAGDCDVQSHYYFRIYFWTPRENIVHCFPVDNVELLDLHRDVIAAFTGSLVSDWTVALNTWNTTRDLEETGRSEEMVDRASRDKTPLLPDKREEVDLDMMALDTINLEEMGMPHSG